MTRVANATAKLAGSAPSIPPIRSSDFPLQIKTTLMTRNRIAMSAQNTVNVPKKTATITRKKPALTGSSRGLRYSSLRSLTLARFCASLWLPDESALDMDHFLAGADSATDVFGASRTIVPQVFGRSCVIASFGADQ